MKSGLLVRHVLAGVGVTMALVAADARAQVHQDQSAARFPQPDPNEYTNQATVGDIDNDGDLDIIWANGGGFSTAQAPLPLRFYINNGSGTFTDGTIAATGGLAFRARGVELGDCDGDGDLDVIVANDFNALPALLINQGPGLLIGTFIDETATRLPNITLSSSRAQFADVDNDGDLDIMIVNGGASNRFGSGPTKLYINNGSGFYTDESASRLPAGNISQPMDVIFADIDGDFDLDVRVVSRATNGTRLWRNNGAGVFTNISGQPAESNCYSYDFGDMDGDGDLDLLGVNAVSGSNAELLLSNNGSGTYSIANPAFPAATNDDNDSKFYDYDNDGDMDVMIAALGGPERAYTNNGTGTYVLQGANSIITSVTDSSLDIMVADFNSDGRYDIITAQGESGSFTNRIYMNVSGPVDDRQPTIARTEQLPNINGTTNGPFPVRVIAYDAHTSDRGFHDKGVTLHWQLVSSPLKDGKEGAFNTTPMKWVGNSEWRGVIPAQASSGVIEYYCTVTDWNNNTATGPVMSFNLGVPCPGDLTGNGVVDIDDLLIVINSWGNQNVTHDVQVADFAFIPSQLDAKSGDTVRWVWVSGIHTTTSGSGCTPNGLFNAPITSGSPQFSYVIPHSMSGQLPYYCTPHCVTGMVANITIAPFPGDANGSGTVDIDDLLLVINGWGPCP